MKPAVHGPVVSEPTAITCPNCRHIVSVRAGDERAHCTYCSNVWNWKTKQLIRGQR